MFWSSWKQRIELLEEAISELRNETIGSLDNVLKWYARKMQMWEEKKSVCNLVVESIVHS